MRTCAATAIMRRQKAVLEMCGSGQWLDQDCAARGGSSQQPWGLSARPPRAGAYAVAGFLWCSPARAPAASNAGGVRLGGGQPG